MRMGNKEKVSLSGNIICRTKQMPTAMILMTDNETSKTDKMMFRTSKALDSPFFSSLSLKYGTKASFSAPSPKRRRKRFGIVKAKIKAANSGLVPRKRAKTASLMKPEKRQIRVPMDMTIIANDRRRVEDELFKIL